MSAPTLFYEQFELGPMQNFVYLLGEASGRDCLVVDPAWDDQVIRARVEAAGRRVAGVLLTHSHPDHLNKVPELLEWADVPVYMMRQEATWSGYRCENLKLLEPGETISLEGLEVTAVHTPGHTPGSTCFAVGGHVLTGDTLFIDGCGRCDLSGGDPEVMYESLGKLLTALPPQTRVLPGHSYGPAATDLLEGQAKTNPYLIQPDLHSFVAYRMRPRR